MIGDVIGIDNFPIILIPIINYLIAMASFIDILF